MWSSILSIHKGYVLGQVSCSQQAVAPEFCGTTGDSVEDADLAHTQTRTQESVSRGAD